MYPMQAYKTLNYKYICENDDSEMINVEAMVRGFCQKKGLIIAGSKAGNYVVEDKNNCRFTAICKAKVSLRWIEFNPTKRIKLESPDLVSSSIKRSNDGVHTCVARPKTDQSIYDFALELLQYCS